MIESWAHRYVAHEADRSKAAFHESPFSPSLCFSLPDWIASFSSAPRPLDPMGSFMRECGIWGLKFFGRDPLFVFGQNVRADMFRQRARFADLFHGCRSWILSHVFSIEIGKFVESKFTIDG